jgi:hypothetical protein
MSTPETAEHRPAGMVVLAVLAWLWVLIPFSYGVWQLISRIPALFG